jgi:hypothetical protein
MKTLIAISLSMLLGLAIGWYSARGYFDHQKAQIVEQMVEGDESSDRERALRAVRAIESIESGNTEQAVQILSTPVAHYYTVYAEAGSKEERRAETRALIEQLARTNHVVAVRLAEVSSNSPVRTR